ncbi:MAG: EamA family transporter [Chryseolinea sp.]
MKKDLLTAYIALGAICLIWGTTYLALRIGVLHFPPFLFVIIRQLASGVLLGGFVLIFAKAQWPSRENILRQAIAGFFMISLGNGLVAYAEVFIPSGVAAILCSLMPVMVILINLAINRDERPTVPIFIGLFVGLLGIVMIFSEHLREFSNFDHQVGIMLIFTAVVSWAGASVWLKKKNSEGNLFLNTALQMFFGGVWLIPCTFLFDDLDGVTWTTEVGIAMAYLIVFGSIVAYACYSYILRKLPLTILSLYAYVNPVVAVVLGWLVLNEKLNLMIAVAICITVGGIYIVNRGYFLGKQWKKQATR